MRVPNLQPKHPKSGLRLAIIGEAPGKDEENHGVMQNGVFVHDPQPFVGASGRFLSALLSRAGISRESCFLGNVSQHRPEDNDISRFSWDGQEIQDGLEELTSDINAFNPNIVLLLGNTPLKAAMDPNTCHALKPKKFRYSVTNWRGSLLHCNEPGSPFLGRKAIATYHPAYALRDYSVAPLLQFDIRKAVREATSPTLILPQRSLLAEPTFAQCVAALEKVKREKPVISPDIEGGIENMSCISLATSAMDSFIVPFGRGSSYWTEAEEFEIWKLLASIMEDEEIKKIFQHGLYDLFVLYYAYGIRVRGLLDDTMLKHWELYCELEKSLAMQASIYTDEPWWKFERKTDDITTFYRYCCRDSAVTYEINNVLTEKFKTLPPGSTTHYRFNMALLRPLLYIELRGIRYDSERAASRRADIRKQLLERQDDLNTAAGLFIPYEDADFLLKECTALMTFKRDATRAKKEYEQTHSRALQLILDPKLHLDRAKRGELSILLKKHINVESPPQFKKLLYEDLGLPAQYHSQTGEETTNYEALLKLVKWTDGKPKYKQANEVCQIAIDVRSLATREQMLSIHADEDGRIRCAYNIVGAETGRITCYESPTGSGYNLQTIPKYDRDLFLADPDFWLFQCDLSGADGWTVAAYCAMLGDKTMLDDYGFGLKPAKIACAILRGLTFDHNNRDDIKRVGREIDSDSWDYFACKRVQHGTNYLMGEIRLSNQILTDSEGKCVISPSECKALQAVYHRRYPGIRKWHDFTARNLSRQAVMTTASGHRRVFFGRREDMLTAALAHEPQANTTYATNLAVYKLWTDPDNRVGGSPNTMGSILPCSSRGMDGEVDPRSIETAPTNGVRLLIEPLHQVHDALVGQFHRERTAWAVGKIKSYFDNPLMIAGQRITIPFEGAYGESWGNTKEGVI